MKFKILLIAFFIQHTGWAQSAELTFLRGKIVCEIKALGEVNITNLRSDSSIASDENGSYSMFVKVGDTLQFKSLQIETKKIVIQPEDLAKTLLVTQLVSKTIALQEVEVKVNKDINAVSLGILQKPAKKYTPAERKLYTAGELHWYSPLLIPFGGMSVDGLLNAINGRTAMLKKELEVERRERLILKIESQFQTDYFIQKLKIPAEYVKGFVYYLAEDQKLTAYINAKDKIQAEFRMSELAALYLEMLKTEKE